MKQALEVEDRPELLRPEAAWTRAGAAAQRAFAGGQVLKALEGIEAVIAKDPAQAWPYALRGELKRSPAIGKFSEALEDLDRACALDPESAWIAGYKAKALAQSGRTAEARELLGRSLVGGLPSPWLLTERALLALEQGESSAALADAEEAARLGPGSERAHLALAASLARSQRWEEALKAARRALSLRETAAEREFAVEGAALPRPHELLFEILRDLKRHALAAESLRRAAEAGERLVWAAPDSRRPDELLAGLAELEEVMGRAGQDAWLFFWKGEMLLRLGRLSAAEEAFSAALRLDRGHARAWAWRGWTRLQSGDLKKSLADWDAALRLCRAASPRKKARSLSPLELLACQLEALRGFALVGLKRLKPAAEAFTRAIAAAPLCSSRHLWRAEVWAALGKKELCEADLRRALELDARSREAFQLRSRVRSERGNFAGALSDLGRAAGLAEGDAALHLDMAYCHGLMGRGEDRDLDLAQAFKAQPEILGGKPRSAQEALKALRRLAMAPRPPLARVKAPAPRYFAARETRSGQFPYRLARAPEPRQRPLGRVVVDPRIELVGVLQTVAMRGPVPAFCREKAPELADYVTEALERFSSFAQPRLLEGLSATARKHSDPAWQWFVTTQMMMGVSEPPELRAESSEWRDGNNLRLLSELRDFSERSRFMDFFARHERLFARWTKPMRKTVEAENYAKTVSSYVGVGINAYYDVVFSPLLRGVNLCAILESQEGARGARTVMCPLSAPEEFDNAMSPDPDHLLWRGWHEILHLVIDRTCEFYAPEIESLSGMYQRVQRRARRRDWLGCVAEHMVRAATQRLLYRRSGAKALDLLARRDRFEDYIFHERLAEKLAEYEAAPQVYPTLVDFFPEWLKALKEQQ